MATDPTKYERINENSVRALVERFYARVRADDVLGPIFEKALAGRWDEHIATLSEFWCSALRVKRGYSGDMLLAHQRLARMSASLFPRWLALFHETVAECFTDEAARIVEDRAQRIARNLEGAIFNRA